MLNAREFLEIDLKQPELEKARLELLYKKLPEQPFEIRRKLSRDVLEIVANPKEKNSVRAGGCLMLGARCKELGISGSKPVIERLKTVLGREFVIFKRTGFLYLKKQINLQPIRMTQFPLLMALLVTMVRIDFKNTILLAETVAAQIGHPGWKKGVDEFLALAKQKSHLPGRQADGGTTPLAS